jgi:hypothetical protein
MNKQQAFEQLAVEFDLKPADFYFLDLIPLIEMVWADGRNQPAELNILYQFAIEHIAYLDRQSGAQAIGIDAANDFLERFALRKPPAKLLEELRHLACVSAAGGDNPRGKTILEYCLDIAAACTTHYPFSPQERVMEDEKKLLEKLFREFNIDPDTLLPY